MSPPRRLVQKPADTKKAFKDLMSLLSNHKLRLAVTILCSVLSTVFTVIGPILIGRATTCIFEGVNRHLHHTGTIDFNLLFYLLGLSIVLYVISGIFTYLQSWLLVEISTTISYNLRKKLVDKVTSMSMGGLDNEKRGDILSRIVNDVDSIQFGITQAFTQMITAVITLVGVCLMMLYINVWMTLSVLVLIPIAFALITFVTSRSQKFFKNRLNFKGQLNGHIEEVFTAHDVVRVYNQEDDVLDEFIETNDKWFANEWKSQFYSSLTEPVMNFISNLSYVLIAVLGALFVLQRTIAVGDILAFFQYVKNFTQPIQQITRVMNQLQNAMAATERIFEFLEHTDEDETGSEEIFDINDSIVFNDVHFGYGDEEIIRGLTFEVKKGEKIAIIGETGAGKSTLVKLLMRFYDVDKGSITIDGKNIKEYSKNSLRSIFGMVLQDTWLFSDTIRENIRYGDLDAGDEAVYGVSSNVNVDGFIRQLSDGYDTRLNEDTDNISYGQKQLLTIARTVLANKKVLILDEATSSVDTRTEMLIQEAMDHLMEGRTSIVIAHRLSTIKNADKIIVIEHGKLLEMGNHDELIAKKGYYYKTLTSSNAIQE